MAWHFPAILFSIMSNRRLMNERRNSNRRRGLLPVLITVLVIIGVAIMWVFTIKEGNEILTRGQNERSPDRDVVYSGGGD